MIDLQHLIPTHGGTIQLCDDCFANALLSSGIRASLPEEISQSKSIVQVKSEVANEPGLQIGKGKDEKAQPTTTLPMLVDLAQPAPLAKAEGADPDRDQEKSLSGLPADRGGDLPVVPRNPASTGIERLHDSVEGENRPESGRPIDGQKQPRVAKEKCTNRATGGHQAQIVNLKVERDRRHKTQQHSPATRGQKSLRKSQPRVAKGKPYVEAVGASVGTMAFRVRWRENGKRQPPVYLSRVSKEVYELIKEGDYEAFKRQLISSYQSGTVRASHTA